ncbi:hypothetical protein ACQR10_05400 [Bradyrhizobium sp. HKCCYLRH2060]|uniref:hypothetical protein n=1 Tax=Bradyrhizobium TaxID=374 RepID=UPI00291664D9|nr:hypothetical protein [Bradyrhizobium sp. SZCCHNR3003]
MAKDSRKSAGANAAEKTGTTLSGLFADENEFDRRALWRLGWWGAGAVGAVGLAVFTNQAAQGWRQDRVSAADLSRQAQLLQSLARETQGEARQLGAAIETLNTDRDRLYARVTVLEQGLDSVTGALAKQSAQASPNPASRAGPAPQIAAVESLAPAAVPSSSVAPSPLPAFANASPFMPIPSGAAGPNPAQPVAPSAAASADKTKQEPASGASSSPVSAAPSPTPSASPAPAVAAAGSKPLPAGAPDPAGKPAETDKLARAEPAEAAGAKGSDSTDAAVTAVQKTEFAVDLGAANSLGGLRALWRDLVRTHADLASLRPIVILKEGRGGPGVQLRLGAGPLSDAATAAKICAVLAESQRACETTVYDGQRLAVREEPEAAKPGAPAAAAPKPVQRRRTYQPQAQQQRHGKREEPPPTAAAPSPPPAEAPKPEQPSALSSFFRRS